MGQSTDQTVRQIEEARDRLGEDLRELEDRLPKQLPTARRALIPVGSAVAATGATWLVVRGVRRRIQARRKPRTLIDRLIPTGMTKSVSRTFDDDGWKFVAVAAGGVWLAVRLAELRQLRRLNRTLAVR